jgi:hypothetical protein
MIYVRLCGGLGNQLFQYAAARRLAHVHQTELVLNTNWFRQITERDTKRDFELSKYPIVGRTLNIFEQRLFQLYGAHVLRRLPIPWPWRLYREKSFDFDPGVLSLPNNAFMFGYWQSYRYFEDVADLIRSELVPLSPPGKQDQIAMDSIRRSNSAISVHIRRGDYVTSEVVSRVHGVCSLDYYHRAAQIMASKVISPHFFVFSDDPHWARENISLPGEVTYVSHNDSNASHQDLRLMSMCKHHIIANSSFSWWGAWLNPSRNKSVVAPKNWFADGKNTNDLIPDEWVRI